MLIDQDSFAPTTAAQSVTSNALIIGNDGKPLNQPFEAQRASENMHIMYLREKPLLDKIRQMRQDKEILERQMKSVLDENAMLSY